MIVAVVLNGDPPSERDLRLLDSCDAIVCADGGARSVLGTGRVPNWIVGDLDSLSEAEAKSAQARGARIEVLAREKNETDGEAAVEKALSLGPARILLLGAHGGDTGHFLANLGLLLRCHRRRVESALVGRGESIRCVSGGQALRLPPGAGTRFHVLAFGGNAVVTLSGTAYDVQHLALLPESSRGASNEVRASDASIEVHEGMALVVLEEP